MKANDPKTTAQVRDFFQQSLTTLNGMMETATLEEPLLGQFNSLKGLYNSVLSDMPMTDAVPAAQQASWALSCLYNCMVSTQTLMSSMTSKLAEYRGKAETALAAVKAAGEESVKLIEIKVKAGELVPKDTVQSLCSAAGEKAVEDFKAAAKVDSDKVASRQKLVLERRQLVVKNALPAPAIDDVLAGTDAEFTAVQAVAKTRFDALRTRGLKPEHVLMSKIWLPKDEFETFEKLVGEMLPGKGVTEPLAGAGGGAASKTRLPV